MRYNDLMSYVDQHQSILIAVTCLVIAVHAVLVLITLLNHGFVIRDDDLEQARKKLNIEGLRTRADGIEASIRRIEREQERRVYGQGPSWDKEAIRMALMEVVQDRERVMRTDLVAYINETFEELFTNMLKRAADEGGAIRSEHV